MRTAPPPPAPLLPDGGDEGNALEPYDPGVGVQAAGEFRVAAQPADVLRVVQVEMVKGQQAARPHRNAGSLASFLQVGDAERQSHPLSPPKASRHHLRPAWEVRYVPADQSAPILAHGGRREANAECLRSPGLYRSGARLDAEGRRVLLDGFFCREVAWSRRKKAALASGRVNAFYWLFQLRKVKGQRACLLNGKSVVEDV